MENKPTKHTEAFQAAKLRSGETVLLTLEGWVGEMMGKGSDAQHNGNLILTDQRVAFYRKGIFGEVFEAIPLEKISSIETRAMMGRRVLIAHTSHNALTFKTFELQPLFDQVYQELERLTHGVSTRGQASAIESESSPIEQIRKLAELRDSGLLSSEEFESKKAELLARI